MLSTTTSRSRWIDGLTVVVAALALGFVLARPAAAAWPTEGGDRGREIEVTTLADDGPGSLRAAMTAQGPRRVVFKVAGEIWLKSTILVRNPYLTVAGETAPSPGISLMGDRAIRLRTHDVILRHLRVRVGARAQGMDPQNRDAMSVDGVKGDPGYNVLVENCSFAWSIDELVQIWGAGTHDVVVRNSILAEGLSKSIHPKGAHGMAMVVGPNTRSILVQGNLFAHNTYRNPVLGGGSHAAVVNNLIYNPLFAGVHFYPSKTKEPTLTAVVGNVVIAGPDTRPRLGMFSKGMNPGSQVFLEDNRSIGTEAFLLGKDGSGGEMITLASPAELPAFDAQPSSEVEASVLRTAGARPDDRDEVDARIVDEVRNRTGKVRNRPTDSRLWPEPGTEPQNQPTKPKKEK